MDLKRNRRHALLSWVFVGVVVVLAAVLGVLQYRWIGEVSRAERERLRGGVQAALRRLSQDFNSEITAACTALMPRPGENEAFEVRYANWRESSRHSALFRRVAMLTSRDGVATLRVFNPEKLAFKDAAWPSEWEAVRERAAAMTSPEITGPRRWLGPLIEESADLIELPRFNRPPGPGGFPPRPPMERPEFEWLILQMDLDYLRTAVIPDLIQRHLAGNGRTLEYDVEIVARNSAGTAIYRSVADGAARIGARADAFAAMFDVQWDRMFRRPFGPFGEGGLDGRRGGKRGRPPAADGPPPDWGRWEIAVRHHSGSLEKLVEQTRRRNAAVMSAILLLMLAAVVALVRFTQRAQRLARLEMEFVAGVSHELRTPLSVIRTAAHNLGGGVVSSPRQVQRYGGLIAQEAERLTGIVEQVLRFASTNAGRTIGAREPVTVEALMESSLAAAAGVLRDSKCTVEKRVDAGLPPVLADPVSLTQALQNLITNAAKYGAQGGWIGISAGMADGKQDAVEIRVADRGPGIPADELEQIFDPFYRGKRAVEDQIHGTGLGLHLVKRIMEAHDGSVSVASAPDTGAEFVLRIPVAPAERADEFTHSAG